MTQTTATRAGARRRRGELSREEIVEAGLRLLDEHGSEELSMRRLAAELGVGTMTIYGYFRDKQELLDAVVDAIGAQRKLPELSGDWREKLRDLFLWFRRHLDENPALVRVRLERPIVTPGSMSFTERGLGILEQAGFPREEAVRAFRALFVHCFGFAAFNPPAQAEEGARDVRVAIAALPRERYPRVTEAAEELAGVMDPDAQFLYDLDLMLDALEARLGRP